MSRSPTAMMALSLFGLAMTQAAARPGDDPPPARYEITLVIPGEEPGSRAWAVINRLAYRSLDSAKLREYVSAFPPGTVIRFDRGCRRSELLPTDEEVGRFAEFCEREGVVFEEIGGA